MVDAGKYRVHPLVTKEMKKKAKIIMERLAKEEELEVKDSCNKINDLTEN